MSHINSREKCEVLQVHLPSSNGSFQPFFCYALEQEDSGTGNRNLEPEPSEPFFPEPKAEPETAGTVSSNRNRNRNRPFLLNCTETPKIPFYRGTAGTENRNRSNRSTPKTATEPNRTEVSLLIEALCIPEKSSLTTSFESPPDSEAHLLFVRTNYSLIRTFPIPSFERCLAWDFEVCPKALKYRNFRSR